MYKPLIIPLLCFALFLSSCDKDEREDEGSFETLSNTEFVEFGPCFLEYRIDTIVVKITDLDTYEQLEKELKNNWDLTGSCNNAHLPEVDFESYFLVGVYTEGAGCDASYTREVSYNSVKDTYLYKISINYTGDCTIPPISSYNWAIVPKKGNSTKISFEIN